MSIPTQAYALLLSAVVAATGVGARAYAQDVRDLRLEACTLDGPGLPAVVAECGRLAVALDPESPPDAQPGPPIELFVARVPAVNPGDAVPMVLLAGGPGQAASGLYLTLRSAFEPIRLDRDIIIVDQRGTGRSGAGLECPRLDPAALELEDAEMLGREVAACLAELDQDPRWFTTSVAVRDLETVRRALGVDQWHLYGISYGTRVAQHYLRRHRETVGAVILDGVVPVSRVLGPDLAENAARMLDALAARCLAENSCASRFGDFRASLRVVLNHLEHDPVTLTMADPALGGAREVALGRAEAAGAVRLLSYQAATQALLPLVIQAALDGHYAPLTGQALIVSREVAGGLSLPMHNSVICSEDAPYFAETATSAADLATRAPGPGPADGTAEGTPIPAAPAPGAREGAYLGPGLLEALQRICAAWPRGPVEADFRAPLQSDAPVLLLSGEFDPVTPPADAHRVMADGLTNALHLIGRGQGHGLAAVGCVPRLMREFLANPVPGELAGECVNRIAAPAFFVDFNGPEP